MRIVYLHQYFNTPDMVGSTRSFEFGRRLVAAGHSVDVVTTWRDPGAAGGWRETEVEGIRVHWLTVPYSNDMGFLARLRAFVVFAFGAARKAAGLPADVVFATSTPLTIALPAAYAARRLAVPMVFEVRDLWPTVPIAIGVLKSSVTKWVARRLERFAYRSSSRVVALSKGMAAGVAETGFPQDRVATIPNAADLELFSGDTKARQRLRTSLGVSDRQILIGYIGTLGYINDVAYLVQLAAAVRDDHRLRFLIVGGGRELGQVRQLAAELEVLDTSVFFVEPQPKSAIPGYFEAVDIATSLVLPINALEANSANKFFDGLAAGRCVAVNHGGWQAELLHEENAGFRLDRNIAVAAGQLAALAEDPLQIAAMGRNARRLAETRYSRDLLAKQLALVLESAVAEGRRP